MKKNEDKKVKKLRLSRETLKVLTDSDTRRVAGASYPDCSFSSMTGLVCCNSDTEGVC
jgi:hypothetical protein